ncbi:hypothetical protein [Bradyrhizobium canariense]|uniref:Uncharacterized protein n=1 Tax=Bradyrhizobium canariense TaxID=255045 RepID=A0A1H2BER1_9BRAD|nr:hypothetical protein [Bradyrhizobium canariense]SDT56755.1 hypothetical protein SAMN05444158_7104 [Bradyrhizobium canariense]
MFVAIIVVSALMLTTQSKASSCCMGKVTRRSACDGDMMDWGKALIWGTVIVAGVLFAVYAAVQYFVTNDGTSTVGYVPLAPHVLTFAYRSSFGLQPIQSTLSASDSIGPSARTNPHSK